MKHIDHSSLWFTYYLCYGTLKSLWNSEIFLLLCLCFDTFPSRVIIYLMMLFELCFSYITFRLPFLICAGISLRIFQHTHIHTHAQLLSIVTMKTYQIVFSLFSPLVFQEQRVYFLSLNFSMRIHVVEKKERKPNKQIKKLARNRKLYCQSYCISTNSCC